MPWSKPKIIAVEKVDTNGNLIDAKHISSLNKKRILQTKNQLSDIKYNRILESYYLKYREDVFKDEIKKELLSKVSKDEMKLLADLANVRKRILYIEEQQANYLQSDSEYLKFLEQYYLKHFEAGISMSNLSELKKMTNRRITEIGQDMRVIMDRHGDTRRIN